MKERVRELFRWAGIVLGALDRERLQLRAMALTYLSLFALVPALVVAFSVVQAFTGMRAVWDRVDAFLLENLAVGARTAIEPYLAKFVKNAHAGSAGVVGGALLFWSAVSLFQNIEHALNDIWRVRRRRPLKQLVLTYWAGLTLGPILLAASLTLGKSVESLLGKSAAALTFTRLAALLLACAFFAVLYLIVPATKVRPRAAIIGGVFAAVAFELAKSGYTYAVGRFFKYHAIYGSVAAVPIFLVWLHLSWTILLAGARIAFVAQHARVLLRGHAPDATPLGRERLAALALLEVARAFHRGEPPPAAEEVADRVDVLPEPVREVLTALRQAGLVVETGGGGILPARPLAQLTLADVRRVINGGALPAEDEGGAAILTPLAAAESAAAASLAEVTYESLCASPRESLAAAWKQGGGRASAGGAPVQ